MTVRKRFIGMIAAGILLPYAQAVELPVTAAFLNNPAAQQALQVLSHPVIAIVLLIMGFVGLVLEILTPGFGPFAVLSLLGFGLFLHRP